VSQDHQASETVELAEQGSTATEPAETAEDADSAGQPQSVSLREPRRTTHAHIFSPRTGCRTLGQTQSLDVRVSLVANVQVVEQTVSQRDSGASQPVDLAQHESVSQDHQASETVELAEQGSTATEPAETAEDADSAGQPQSVSLREPRRTTHAHIFSPRTGCRTLGQTQSLDVRVSSLASVQAASHGFVDLRGCWTPSGPTPRRVTAVRCTEVSPERRQSASPTRQGWNKLAARDSCIAARVPRSGNVPTRPQRQPGGRPLGTSPTNGALLPQELFNGNGASVIDREPANSTALPQDQRVNRLFTEVAEALGCARALRNSQVQQVQCEPQHPQLFHQLRQPSQVLPVNHQKPAQGQPETEHGPDKSSNVPWLARLVVDARRAALGLREGRIAKFAESCKFVSLGSYCAVARALQSLDLKRYTYPFDWTRSPMEGIIRCLNNRFADFLTHSSFKDHDASGKCYGNCMWGGSFWHHDPTDAKTRKDFQRRIDRFYGHLEVDALKPRVFVRAANSTQDVALATKLFESLQRAIPGCPVYLLLLVDNQPCVGPVRLPGHEHDNLLIWRGGEGLYTENGKNWSMQKQAEAYADAVAYAIRHWAGQPLESDARVDEVRSLDQLTSSLVSFDGGHAGSELYWPRRQATRSSFRKPVVAMTPPVMFSQRTVSPTAVSPRVTPPGCPVGSRWVNISAADDCSAGRVVQPASFVRRPGVPVSLCAGRTSVQSARPYGFVSPVRTRGG